MIAPLTIGGHEAIRIVEAVCALVAAELNPAHPVQPEQMLAFLGVECIFCHGENSAWFLAGELLMVCNRDMWFGDEAAVSQFLSGLSLQVDPLTLATANLNLTKIAAVRSADPGQRLHRQFYHHTFRAGGKGAE